MKKRFLVSLLMVFLFSAALAAASSGSASGTKNLTFQLGLPTSADHNNFYDSGYPFEFYADSSRLGSSISWSCQSTDDGPELTVKGPTRADDDRPTCWVHLDPNEHYTTGTSFHYKVSATFQDGSISWEEFTVSFVDDLPEEDTYFIVTPIDDSTSPVTFGEPVRWDNGSIDLVTGQVYAVSFHAGTNNHFSSYGYGQGWSGEKGWDEIEPYLEGNEKWRNLGLDSTQLLYRAGSPGVHPYANLMYYADSNLRRDVSYTLNVYDTNGNLPQLVPEMSGDFLWRTGLSAEVLDVTVYLGLPLDGANGVWNNSEIVAIYLSNRTLLEDIYGGSPEWSMDVKTISGSGTLNLSNLHADPNGYRVSASLLSMPSQPMEAEVTVNCKWGSVTGSKKIRIHVKQPTFTMPDGLTNIPDIFQTKVGETITLDPQISPAGWSLPGYEGRYYTRHALSSFATQDLSGSGYHAYTVNRAGTYHEIIEIQFGALSVSKEVTFEVAEADPELPNGAVDSQLVMMEGLTIDTLLSGFISESEPDDGRVATLQFVLDVSAPSSVTGVWVGSWWETKPTAAEACSMAQNMASTWQEYGPYPEETVPFRTVIDRPVFDYDLGTNQYTLLVGIDKDVNMVGYAVVKTVIPGQYIASRLVLPGNLTVVESEAFLNVIASEIDIPDGVTFIGQDAFPRGATLIVGSGTYAETWARQNGYTTVVR